MVKLEGSLSKFFCKKTPSHPMWGWSHYPIASHADVLRGSSRVPAPWMLLTWAEKKLRPITADFQIWEVHFGLWEILRFTLWLHKRSERSHERWGPYSFRINYSVNSQAFILVAVPTISLKRLPQRLNLLNGSRLYYKAIMCEKKSAFCSVLQGDKAVASPKEQLYEQITSNPALTERNTYKKPTIIS